MNKNPAIYLVGGAVRDKLLGLSMVERDWVVTGADRDWMLRQKFRPADPFFPVFLHPDTGEEYALARTETKVADGYRGFTFHSNPEITLEQDLARRDLTINAMAEDRDGKLIDLHHGRDDLDQGVLRHVSPAFAEDPLRLLRIARFSALLGHWGFHIAHSTHKLMKKMSQSADLEALHQERIWREMSKAMSHEQPWRFFEVLHKCAALSVLMPEIATALGTPDGHGSKASAPIRAMQRIASSSSKAQLRLAVLLVTALQKKGDSAISDWCVTHCVERSYKEMALRLSQTVQLVDGVLAKEVDVICQLLKILRVELNTEFLQDFTLAVEAMLPDKAASLEQILQLVVPVWKSSSGSSLKAEGYAGSAIGNELSRRRKSAISHAIQ